METKRLDAEQLTYLNAADKQRLAELEDMFATPGWQKHLAPLAAKLAEEAHNRAANSGTWEANRINIGMREAYKHIALMEPATQLEFLEIADSNRQALLEADLGDEISHQS